MRKFQPVENRSRIARRIASLSLCILCLTLSQGTWAAKLKAPKLVLTPLSATSGNPLPVQVIMNGKIPVGAYTLRISFDKNVAELVGITGGGGTGFSDAPVFDPASLASGTVKFSGYQAVSLTSPTGLVHVATLSFRTKTMTAGVSAAAKVKPVKVKLTLDSVTMADTSGAEYLPKAVSKTVSLPLP